MSRVNKDKMTKGRGVEEKGEETKGKERDERDIMGEMRGDRRV